MEKSHAHLTAEFFGVSAEQLRDATLLGGLLIAAASSAGLIAPGFPNVRDRGDEGVSAILLVDVGHMALHSIPAQQTLLFDLVAPASHDFRKAVDVIARRLASRDIKSETRGRG